MERSEDGWREVGERFRALAEQLGRHYRETEGPEARTPQAFQEALDSLVEAADRVATSTGEAIRDPAVKETGREAIAALADALEVTFVDLGARVRRRSDEGEEAGSEEDGGTP